MATVTTTITWASDEAGLRTYLGIPSGEDERLERLLSSAVHAADTFLANAFEDSDGADTLTGRTLDSIREGVYAWVYSVRATEGTTGPTPGLTSVKTGDLSEGYAGSAVTRISAGALALSAARPHWEPWRCQVWR